MRDILHVRQKGSLYDIQVFFFFFGILKNVGVYETLTAVGPDITVKALDRGLCNRGDTILCSRRAPANKN